MRLFQREFIENASVNCVQSAAFLPENFHRCSKICCYANFCIVFGQNFRGDGKLLQEAPPCPSVEESQSVIDNVILMSYPG